MRFAIDLVWTCVGTVDAQATAVMRDERKVNRPSLAENEAITHVFSLSLEFPNLAQVQHPSLSLLPNVLFALPSCSLIRITLLRLFCSNSAARWAVSSAARRRWERVRRAM